MTIYSPIYQQKFRKFDLCPHLPTSAQSIEVHSEQYIAMWVIFHDSIFHINITPQHPKPNFFVSFLLRFCLIAEIYFIHLFLIILLESVLKPHPKIQI